MERCTWCGAEVEPGRRLSAPTSRRASAAPSSAAWSTSIPWSIQGAHWDAGTLTEPVGLDEGASRCSHCGEQLTDAHVLLVRHRGDHRVADAFCSVDHLNEWAKAGGRWQ